MHKKDRKITPFFLLQCAQNASNCISGDLFFSLIFQWSMPPDLPRCPCPLGTQNTPAGYFKIFADYIKICGEHSFGLFVHNYFLLKQVTRMYTNMEGINSLTSCENFWPAVIQMHCKKTTINAILRPTKNPKTHCKRESCKRILQAFHQPKITSFHVLT